MSKKAELLALAERVEAGSGSDLILRAEVFKALPREHWLDMDITISIDAVEELRGRLLPNSEIESHGAQFHWGFQWTAKINHRVRKDRQWSEAASEPRARLGALLRAYADRVE